jgi:hypothetical protein
MDLEILINDTLQHNKYVDVDDVRRSIRDLYPDFNLVELDTFYNYVINNNLDNCKFQKWAQYYKIHSHYKNGRGTLTTIEYVSAFDLYCQINGLYKSDNYYY